MCSILDCASCKRGMKQGIERCLGFHKMQPRRKPGAWAKFADNYKNIDVKLLNINDKQDHSMTFDKYWQGLFDETKFWNICDRLSTREGGLTLHPPILFNNKVHYFSMLLITKDLRDLNLTFS